LIAGQPGAGKTTFSAEFLYTGATQYGEKGVYMCFAETKKSLLRSMLRFGWDFERLELEKRCTILDLSTSKESGIQSNIDAMLREVTQLQAKRLVIDSFTAMSMALKEAIDIRYLIHLLYKFLQNTGCTTLMISDTPWGSNKIGSGIEEFIADGIISMNTRFDESGQLTRKMRILKMRNTNHSLMTHKYTITPQGVVVLPALEVVAAPAPKSRKKTAKI
jgi:circadian clock protein KaiC